jgi:myo-inositol-1(or 4)-monophosphatase
LSRERAADLVRIREALAAAGELLRRFTPGEVASRFKAGDDPVTEADTELDALLRERLPRPGEGWLSEETEDDPARLACRRVWVVDPLDGTREFVQGIPEWCVSVGLVEAGQPVAGGLLNPATGELILGAAGLGVTRNGEPVRIATRTRLEGARILASRSEVRRGEWAGYLPAGFEVVPTGSVAYKLGRVAAGLADATWTLTPKHEWDVAAGCALVLAAGGALRSDGNGDVLFNRPHPKLPDLIAAPPALLPEIERAIGRRR